jgi:hypothetical protein
MANGDPLRAQEIYEDLSGEWYHYWILWRNAKAGKKSGVEVKPGTWDKIKHKFGLGRRR